MSDAERWGNALNEAAWEYVESFQTIVGEEISSRHWNNAKEVLRKAILRYEAILTQKKPQSMRPFPAIARKLCLKP